MDTNVNSPLVTVLMPVYNAELYVAEAIESILIQKYTNFEFLIINDGSNDKSEEIILSYNDTRIRYIKNEHNIQLIATLNKGLELSKGKYIARMDADDISLPNRLQEQVAFMEEHSDYGICGSWVETFGIENKVIRYPETHDEIAVSLLFYSSISHPASMWRLDFFKAYRLSIKYDYIYAEDYKLWTDSIFHFKVYNIPNILVKYRIHANQKGLTDINVSSTKRIKIELIKKFEIKFTCDEELELESMLQNNLINYKSTIRIISKICKANSKLNLYNRRLLERKFSNMWKNAFLLKNTLTYTEIYLFFTSHITFYNNFTIRQYLYIFYKFLLKKT